MANQPDRTTVQAPLPVGATTQLKPGAAGASSQQRPGHFAQAAHGAPQDEPPRAHRGRRIALLALGVVAALLVVAYGVGVAVFSNLTYPNTEIAGIDVSLSDAGTAAARIERAWTGYALRVEGAGFTWEYVPESERSIVNGEKAAESVIAMNEPFAWPIHLFRALTDDGSAKDVGAAVDLSADVDTSYLSDAFDEGAFDESLGAAVDEFNEGRSGTFTAESGYDAEQGKLTVERARSNQKLDRDNVIKFAKIALASLSQTASLDEIGQDAFEPLAGGATDEQLQAACDAANALLGTDVTFKLGGSDAGTLNSETLLPWISFDDELEPTLDEEQVSAWARDLASKMNTVGTERTYTREDGKSITVSGGVYGWSVNVDELVASAEEAVANRQTGDIDVPTSSKGAVYNGQGARDWGAYVDIDLSEQHARYYDASGNLLWESGIISGNPNEGNSTPTGVYYLNSNNGGSTLIGKIDPETNEPEYKTPVDYWMPFVGNAVGLHDASWQASSNFSNPNAYKYVGSHGCINLPPAKAKELSGMIHVGDCVITHW